MPERLLAVMLDLRLSLGGHGESVNGIEGVIRTEGKMLHPHTELNWPRSLVG